VFPVDDPFPGGIIEPISKLTTAFAPVSVVREFARFEHLAEQL
jgi:hypothetical protein